MSDNIPGYIYRKFAEEHLALAGYSDPASAVNELYEQCLPDSEQYNHEVEQFGSHYRNVMEKAVYLDIIEKMVGDDSVLYKRLYEQGRTSEGRLANGGDAYKEALTQIPEYNPADKDGFLSRFDELPEQVHEAVYREAVRIAKDNLQNSRL
ncbi:MAG: hypothetical protein OXD47_05225 [Gammaproteobacteria bacterium]|nr:hypothetical protein [Gammaproteobacteria bacterium]MCY4338186.1 hypothetical protein [Gammaproteobacteria bacterium]